MMKIPQLSLIVSSMTLVGGKGAPGQISRSMLVSKNVRVKYAWMGFRPTAKFHAAKNVRKANAGNCEWSEETEADVIKACGVTGHHFESWGKGLTTSKYPRFDRECPACVSTTERSVTDIAKIHPMAWLTKQKGIIASCDVRPKSTLLKL